MREYKIGTFCEPGETRKSKVHAYSTWYSPEWRGCVEYTVVANTGTEAKKLAVAKRLEHEAAKRERDKARILITTACNRKCDGCCNTYESIMASMQTITSLDSVAGYKVILLTGGEPMLMPDAVESMIDRLRQITPDSTLYLYTAWYNKRLEDIIPKLDGLQYTLHVGATDADVVLFNQMQALLSSHQERWQEKSFRLYVDNRVTLPIQIIPSLWDDVTMCAWKTEDELHDDYPGGLPKGEELFFYNAKRQLR